MRRRDNAKRLKALQEHMRRSKATAKPAKKKEEPKAEEKEDKPKRKKKIVAKED